MSETTCTVQSAITGPCGKPAVTTFIARNGEVLGECADHAPEGERIQAIIDRGAPAPFTVGQDVVVTHGGISKVGVVTAVRASRADVRVPIHGGQDEKVITRAFSEIVTV